MILSAHQPALMPWLGYFHKLAHCDLFVILDDVQFSDGSAEDNWIKHTRIKVESGNPFLTIPVKQAGHLGKPIRDMEIADEPWQERHAGKLRQSYRKAPHFDEWFLAWQHAMASYDGSLMGPCSFTVAIARALGISTPVEFQSARRIRGENGLDLIERLCRMFGATGFLFGVCGFDNYGHSLRSAKAIRQEYRPPDSPPFSIIHYLMELGDEETRRLIG